MTQTTNDPADTGEAKAASSQGYITIGQQSDNTDIDEATTGTADEALSPAEADVPEKDGAPEKTEVPEPVNVDAEEAFAAADEAGDVLDDDTDDDAKESASGDDGDDEPASTEEADNDETEANGADEEGASSEDEADSGEIEASGADEEGASSEDDEPGDFDGMTDDAKDESEDDAAEVDDTAETSDVAADDAASADDGDTTIDEPTLPRWAPWEDDEVASDASDATGPLEVHDIPREGMSSYIHEVTEEEIDSVLDAELDSLASAAYERDSFAEQLMGSRLDRRPLADVLPDIDIKPRRGAFPAPKRAEDDAQDPGKPPAQTSRAANSPAPSDDRPASETPAPNDQKDIEAQIDAVLNTDVPEPEPAEEEIRMDEEVEAIMSSITGGLKPGKATPDTSTATQNDMPSSVPAHDVADTARIAHRTRAAATDAQRQPADLAGTTHDDAPHGWRIPNDRAERWKLPEDQDDAQANERQGEGADAADETTADVTGDATPAPIADADATASLAAANPTPTGDPAANTAATDDDAGATAPTEDASERPAQHRIRSLEPVSLEDPDNAERLGANVNELIGLFRASQLGGSQGNGRQVTLALERFVIDRATGTTVGFEGPQGVEQLLGHMEKYYPNGRVERDGRLMGLRTRLAVGIHDIGLAVTVGPAAQLVVTVGPSHSPSALLRTIDACDRQVHVAAGELGLSLELVAQGYNPTVSSPLDLDLVPDARYGLQNIHLTRTGAYARDMMRCCASTRVCVAYVGEHEAVRAIRLAAALSPVLSFLTDNILSVRGSAPHKTPRMSRLKIWDNVDASRCGLPAGIFDDDFGFSSYIGWLGGLTPLMLSTPEGEVLSCDRMSTNEVMMTQELTRPQLAGLCGTALTEVRWRGSTEIRCADALTPRQAAGYAAFLAGIFQNHASMTAAEKIVGIESVTPQAVLQVRQALEQVGWGAQAYGRPVTSLVDGLLIVARRAIADPDDRATLNNIAQLWEAHMSPRDIPLRSMGTHASASR